MRNSTVKYLSLILLYSFLLSCEKSGNTKDKLETTYIRIENGADNIPVQSMVIGDNLFVLSTLSDRNEMQLVTLELDTHRGGHFWISSGNLSVARAMVQDGEDIIVCSGLVAGEGMEHIQLNRISADGGLIQQETIWNTSLEKTSKIIDKNQEEFLLAGYRKDKDTGVLGILIYTLNKASLQVQSEKYIPGVVLSVAADIKAKLDGTGFYLFGHEISEEGEETDLFLYELNNELEIVKIQDQFGGVEYEEASELIIDEGGFIYLLGHSASEDIHHNVYLAKLDADFKVIFENQYGGVHHDGGESFTLNEENTFSIIGRSNSTPNGDQSILYLRVDKSGKEIENEILGDDKDNRADYIVHHNGVDYITGYGIDHKGDKNVEVFFVNR